MGIFNMSQIQSYHLLHPLIVLPGSTDQLSMLVLLPCYQIYFLNVSEQGKKWTCFSYGSCASAGYTNLLDKNAVRIQPLDRYDFEKHVLDVS